MRLVGGWWRYKAIAVVDAAPDRLEEPPRGGHRAPLDESILERWRACLV